MRPSDRLIDDLVAAITRVRRTSPARPLALAALIIGLQCAAAFALGQVRPDVAGGQPSAIVMWRVAASGLIAALALAMTTALRSPAPRLNGWPAATLAAALVAVVAGWGLDLAFPSPLPLLDRLRLLKGLHCIAVVTANGLPVLALLIAALRRGATVRPVAAATWSGLAAAASGGLVWALACPIDDPFYATFWYAVSFGVLAGAARGLLPPVVALRARQAL